MTSDFIVQDMVREERRDRQRELEAYEKSQALYPATVRSFSGSARPRWDDNLLWVKLFNVEVDLTAVWNGGVITGEDAAIIGTPVFLKKAPRSPYQFQIVGINFAHVSGSSSGGSGGGSIGNHQVAHHAENHQIPTEGNPGSDPLYVYLPMLKMLKTEGNGTDLTVIVYPHVYIYNGVRYTFPGQYVDLTSYVPGAGLKRRVLLYLDEALGSIQVVSGATVSSTGTTPAPYPILPENGIGSAYVELTNGQTSITTAMHVEDARDILTGNSSSDLPDASAEGDVLRANDALDWVATSIPSIDENGNVDLGGQEIRNYKEQVVEASPASPYDIDWSAASVYEITLTENTTFTFSNLAAGRSLTIVIIQGGSGSYTVNWPGSVAWASGAAPTLSTSVGAVDDITLFVRADGSTVHAFAAGLDMS